MSVGGRVAVLLVLLAPAPALAADPLEEVHLPPQSFVVTKIKLKAGTVYPMEISGTRRKDYDEGDTHITEFQDAFFCFRHGKTFDPHPCPDDDPQDNGVVAHPQDVVAISARTSETTTPHPIGELVVDGEPSRINPAWRHPPYSKDHVYTVSFRPKLSGKLTLATSETCTGPKCTGDGYDIKIFPPKPEDDPCASPARAHAAANEVRVIGVQPSVEVHRAGTPADCWEELEKDTLLQQGDEISCDPDGAVALQFENGTQVVIEDTTQLKIASFFTKDGVDFTLFKLQQGRILATVPRPFVPKSDFKIKSPTGTASVRGTVFSVSYDPGSKSMLTTTKEGVVEVDPDKAGLPTVQVPAGKEVEVTSSAMSKVVAAGKAGARNGVGRFVALDRVLKIVARANGPCKVSTPRTGATAVKPVSGGWAVTVRLTGRHKGTARWTVKGKRTKATNALAKRVAKRCS
jgi:hypothetical protein